MKEREIGPLTKEEALALPHSIWSSSCVFHVPKREVSRSSMRRRVHPLCVRRLLLLSVSHTPPVSAYKRRRAQVKVTEVHVRMKRGRRYLQRTRRSCVCWKVLLVRVSR